MAGWEGGVDVSRRKGGESVGENHIVIMSVIAARGVPGVGCGGRGGGGVESL